MDPLSIIGAVAGIGQTIGQGIASIVKKKKQEQEKNKPTIQREGAPAMDVTPGTGDVAGGVNPAQGQPDAQLPVPAIAAQPLPFTGGEAPQQQPLPFPAPQQGQVQPQPQPLPYTKNRNDWLLQAFMRNQG